MDVRQFMKLAIYLASKAERDGVKTNPKVGAVLTYNGKVIGQGYHMRCGEAHAETNCLNSVPTNLRHLIPQSTMFVTLEPCAHEGRTPSCAKRLVSEGIKKVYVGTLDPFPKVAGKGCQILRNGGAEVVVGLLEKECKEVAQVFMTNQILHRPYITLKWAESADGFIDTLRSAEEQPAKISTSYIQLLTHKLRSEHDAILVGKNTMLMDHPLLNNRLYPGRPSPQAYILDSHAITAPLIQGTDNWNIIVGNQPLTEILTTLYDNQVRSLLVEGGAKVLNSFITNGLWDHIRREISPMKIGEGISAPTLPHGIKPNRIAIIDRHQLLYYTKTI